MLATYNGSTNYNKLLPWSENYCRIGSTHSGTVARYVTVVHKNRHRKTAYIIFTNAFSDAVINGVRLLMRKLKEQYGG